MQLELVEEQKFINKDEQFGGKIGLISTLFGCRHKDLSRPFTFATQSYRVCLRCGARRHFDTRTLQTYGAFYFPPVDSNKSVCV